MSGQIETLTRDSLVSTYSAIFNGLAAYATPTDIIVLQNPATLTIAGQAGQPNPAVLRLTRIELYAFSTAASSNVAFLTKRTALDTVGAFSAATPMNHDSNDAGVLNYPGALSPFVGPVGIVGNYTSAPTLNGTPTRGRVDQLFLQAAGSILPDRVVWEFGTRAGAKCPLLRAGQQIGVDLNGAAIAAGFALSAYIEWTEAAPY